MIWSRSSRALFSRSLLCKGCADISNTAMTCTQSPFTASIGNHGRMTNEVKTAGPRPSMPKTVIFVSQFRNELFRGESEKR